MVTGAACIAGVVLLTVAVVVADGPTSLDQSLSSWVDRHRSPGAASLMEVLAVAGSAMAIRVVGVGCLIGGLARDGRRSILFVIPTTLSESLTTNPIELVIADPTRRTTSRRALLRVLLSVRPRHHCALVRSRRCAGEVRPPAGQDLLVVRPP